MDEDFGETEGGESEAPEFEAETSDFEAETGGKTFSTSDEPAEAPAPASRRQVGEANEADRGEVPRQQQAPDWESQVRQAYGQWQPKLNQWANTPGHIGATFAKNPTLATHAMFSFLDKLDADPRGTIAVLQQAYGVQPDLSPDHRRMIGQATYQAESAKLQAVLDDFTRDKPHYAELRPAVVQEIMAIRRTSPTLPADQCLRLAYHNVMERTGYNNVLEQRREAERMQRQAQQEVERTRQMRIKAEKARKSASVNVRSHMSNTATPKTIDDTLSVIANKYYGR